MGFGTRGGFGGGAGGPVDLGRLNLTKQVVKPVIYGGSNTNLTRTIPAPVITYTIT